MQKPQKVNLFQIFKWLSERYIQLEKQTLAYPCRLSYFDNNKLFISKKGKVFVKIEFSGQKEIVDAELSQIIEQNLFEYFSPTDKKKIFSSYYNTEQFKLTDSYYCQEKKTEMAVLTEILTGHIITQPAYLISENEILLNQLSSKDIKKLSFLSASEHFKMLFKGRKK